MLKVLKKKQLVVGLVVLACCCAVVIGVLNRGGTPGLDNTSNSTQAYEVKLSQTIIDAAVDACKDSEVWTIALADVRVTYIAGVGVEAAIVIHNGNDAERIITLAYQPISTPQMDGDTGEYYDPAPTAARDWVKIDTTRVRLAEMETKVVKIHLFVPGGTEIEPEQWEFRISATGIAIDRYTMDLIVTTVTNDDTLVVILNQPLLQDDVSAVLSVVSSIEGETPYVVGYDKGTRELTISGLKDNSVRAMTLVYEYGLMFRIGYNQRWLIKML